MCSSDLSRHFVNGLCVSFGERPGATPGEHRVDRVGRAAHLVGYRVGPEALFVKVKQVAAFPVGSPGSTLPTFRKRSLPCTFTFTSFPSAFTSPAEGPEQPAQKPDHRHLRSPGSGLVGPPPASIFIFHLRFFVPHIHTLLAMRARKHEIGRAHV